MANQTMAPAVNLQGVAVQPEQINPQAFMALTRRKRASEQARTFAGLGQPDNLQILKSDILSRARVRFSGYVTIAVGTGTASTTAAWPYGLAKNVKANANGQTNLIDASGPALKVREFITRPELNDRGIVRTVGGVSVSQATLSKNSENWGIGQSSTLTSGTFPVEIDWLVPLAEDDKDLSGAIFCQTSSLDISVNVQWANLTDLFNLIGNATAVLAGTVILETEKFSIPSYGGSMVLPDLSLYHSLVETAFNQVANGDNTPTLIGQGSGKSLLRLFFRTLNGLGAAAVPLAVNAANYGSQAWKYGTSDQPETYHDGTGLREQNETDCGTDIAGVWGFLLHDYAVTNAFRDSIDMGQTSELRFLCNIPNTVSLVSPSLLYTQEIVFSAGG